MREGAVLPLLVSNSFALPIRGNTWFHALAETLQHSTCMGHESMTTLQLEATVALAHEHFNSGITLLFI